MLFPEVGRKQLHVRIGWAFVVGFLCLGVFLHLLPFYFMITTSFKTGYETLSAPPTLWPQQPTLTGWRLVFSLLSSSDNTVQTLMDGNPFYVYLWNSLVMTGLTLLLSLPITSLAAYSCSKLMRGFAARWTFLFFIGTLMLPGVVTIVPSLLLVINFPFALPGAPNLPGSDQPFPTFPLYNSIWAVIIPGVFNAFNFLLFKGFFDTIPDSILQAARVDGGSELNIFRRIALPMSIPVYAVAFWTQFDGSWNSFLWPQLVIRDPNSSPVAVEIYGLMNRFTQAGTTPSTNINKSRELIVLLSQGLSWNGLMVLGLLQTIPVFIVFIVCREYLLKGIQIRGLR